MTSPTVGSWAAMIVLATALAGCGGDAADDINLDTTCPPRVPGATKICLRGA
jgi:hypothetical protein